MDGCSIMFVIKRTKENENKLMRKSSQTYDLSSILFIKRFKDKVRNY